MSNTLLTVSAITAEALRVLHNSCPFTANIDKQHDKNTTFGGQKRGASLSIRKPAQYSVRRTWTLNAQETIETSATLTIGQIFGVDMYFTDADLALNINDFSKQFIVPAISTLASTIDAYNYEQAVKSTYNLVGTAGTTPNSSAPYLSAGQKLNECVAPPPGRKVIINPAAQAATVGGLLSLFNPSSAISKQYVDGTMGTALGFDWYMSQNVYALTCGTRSGTILVDDAAATYAVEGNTTLHVDGLGGATQTFVAGDVLTVNGVYAVNPETKQSTGSLQQFVVTTAATASGSEVDLTVSPAIYTTGARKNVTAYFVDGQSVTVVGTASTAYPQNLAFHPDAHTFATANLEMPNGIDFKAQKSVDGINMRILRNYDINNASYPCRIDVFGGFVTQRPELSCRIIG